ncbi:hypothetical protein D3C81_1853030 [compost metagenome]
MVRTPEEKLTEAYDNHSCPAPSVQGTIVSHSAYNAGFQAGIRFTLQTIEYERDVPGVYDVPVKDLKDLARRVFHE